MKTPAEKCAERIQSLPTLVIDKETRLIQIAAIIQSEYARTCCLCGQEIQHAVEKAQLVEGFAMHHRCWFEKIEQPRDKCSKHAPTIQVAREAIEDIRDTAHELMHHKATNKSELMMKATASTFYNKAVTALKQL